MPNKASSENKPQIIKISDRRKIQLLQPTVCSDQILLE